MEEYIGAIKLFAGNYAPRCYMECAGQLLQVRQYQAMFAILGTAYGGDGRETFALPKLESPVPGCRYIICVDGLFPTRD